LYQDTYHDTCITDTPQHWVIYCALCRNL